jgi:hypothetical protein
MGRAWSSRTRNYSQSVAAIAHEITVNIVAAIALMHSEYHSQLPKKTKVNKSKVPRWGNRRLKCWPKLAETWTYSTTCTTRLTRSCRNCKRRSRSSVPSGIPAANLVRYSVPVAGDYLHAVIIMKFDSHSHAHGSEHEKIQTGNMFCYKQQVA